MSHLKMLTRSHLTIKNKSWITGGKSSPMAKEHDLIQLMSTMIPSLHACDSHWRSRSHSIQFKKGLKVTRITTAFLPALPNITCFIFYGEIFNWLHILQIVSIKRKRKDPSKGPSITSLIKVKTLSKLFCSLRTVTIHNYSIKILITWQSSDTLLF